jgi:hypothetical protein
MGNVITKFKTVKVPYTVQTISAPYVSRLMGKMESPRQVPTWGEYTTGSMAKYSDTDSWGWEVTKGGYTTKDEYVVVRYYRNSQMTSGRLEIEAIKTYLEDLGLETSEPQYQYGKSWRRNSDGEYQDYEEERSVYIRVSKPEETFSGHCRTCLCENVE